MFRAQLTTTEDAALKSVGYEDIFGQGEDQVGAGTVLARLLAFREDLIVT